MRDRSQVEGRKILWLLAHLSNHPELDDRCGLCGGWEDVESF